MRILTAAECRDLDWRAAESYGLPVALLMENAGRAVAEAAELQARPPRSGRLVIFAGTGNNGGDGLVAARYLLEKGLRPEVVLCGDAAHCTGAALDNLERWKQLGVLHEAGPLPSLGSGDVAIDALFGTGLGRPPEGIAAQAIAWMNRARSDGSFTLSVDVPSGLDSDSGQPKGSCVQADVTVTFVAPKRGLCQEPGASLAGRLVVASIGLPQQALEQLGHSVELLEEEQVRAFFSKRDLSSFKNDYGHLLVIAGSPGKSGAAALVTRGALRAGAGLVTLCSHSSVLSLALGGTPEAMTIALGGEEALSPSHLEPLLEAARHKTALVIGPGIPRGPETGTLIAQLLAEFRGPVVLDADALNALADNPDRLRAAAGPLVLTPHPGEMGRLARLPPAAIQSDRLHIAQDFARAHRVTLILKGAKSVVADPDGRLAVVPTGNPGLATGGTGDVLAGIVGGLLAQGLAVAAAARAGPYLHGLAGDRLSLRYGQRGLLAGDLPEELASIWADWEL